MLHLTEKQASEYVDSVPYVVDVMNDVKPYLLTSMMWYVGTVVIPEITLDIFIICIRAGFDVICCVDECSVCMLKSTLENLINLGRGRVYQMDGELELDGFVKLSALSELFSYNAVNLALKLAGDTLIDPTNRNEVTIHFAGSEAETVLRFRDDDRFSKIFTGLPREVEDDRYDILTEFPVQFRNTPVGSTVNCGIYGYLNNMANYSLENWHIWMDGTGFILMFTRDDNPIDVTVNVVDTYGEGDFKTYNSALILDDPSSYEKVVKGGLGTHSWTGWMPRNVYYWTDDSIANTHDLGTLTFRGITKRFLYQYKPRRVLNGILDSQDRYMVTQNEISLQDAFVWNGLSSPYQYEVFTIAGFSVSNIRNVGKNLNNLRRGFYTFPSKQFLRLYDRMWSVPYAYNVVSNDVLTTYAKNEVFHDSTTFYDSRMMPLRDFICMAIGFGVYVPTYMSMSSPLLDMWNVLIVGEFMDELYYNQLTYTSASLMNRSMSMAIRDLLQMKADALYDMRFDLLKQRSKYKTLEKTRFRGLFKYYPEDGHDEYELVDPSGHFINLILLSAYRTVHWHSYFIHIFSNLSFVFKEAAGNFESSEKVERRNALWHNYDDYSLAIEIGGEMYHILYNEPFPLTEMLQTSLDSMTALLSRRKKARFLNDDPYAYALYRDEEENIS
jgi:hypothetical protein